ncbi:MAG: DNA recombination protein RmuC [Bacteroidales bacterium]|nr:DNA recombination protein RmuC [Bacteroidales bacterium]
MSGLEIILLIVAIVAVLAGIAAVMIVSSRYQAKLLETVKLELRLESEKALKEREESLKKEAEETIKALTGGLNKDIKDMKEAFDAQKRAHAEESSAIKTKFDETVKNLRQQTDSIGTKADNLASALKGKNKMQGIFGETILENILKAEGLRLGKDYDAEFYLRDRKGNIIVNEETQRRMRPDFALHFPDNTDILIDSKVSMSALADYFDATTPEEKADAAARNLESVLNHVKELTGKEYQKFVQGRKTLDYVIMFIPNYGAYQLAKQEDKDIFAKAFAQNVLITTEETLIPFLRLIRSAWVQKEQMDNMQEIVDDAQKMIDRIALFFDDNAKLQKDLEDVLEGFKKNTERLTTGKQSVLKAAHEVVQHGVAPTKRELPPYTEEQ